MESGRLPCKPTVYGLRLSLAIISQNLNFIFLVLVCKSPTMFSATGSSHFPTVKNYSSRLGVDLIKHSGNMKVLVQVHWLADKIA